jgi:Tol biopolymer transport system component
MTDEPISDSVIPIGLFKRHKWAVVGTSLAVVVLAAGATTLSQILRFQAKVPAEPTQERLTFNSSDRPVSSFALSADAEHLAYADQAGIHVKLLLTGEERLIPKPKRASANASWEIASWFRDGTRLLVHLGVNVLAEAGEPASTWAVPVLGQSPQQLKDGAWGWEVSPDGARIAFSPRRSSGGDAREIWVMDRRGSNPQKVLAAEGNEWLSTVRWSPDGRRLAYLRVRRSPPFDTNSVETCDLNGANCAVVVPPEVGHWHNDFSWLPGGRIIYIRQGSSLAPVNDLWQREIDSRLGKPIAQPKQITHWAESDAINLSASADGKHLAVLKQTSHGQIDVGELTANGTRVNALRRLTNDEAFGYPSDWTPDSAAVLLTYNHNGQTKIIKQPIAQQAGEPLALELANAYLPRISPDGKWIIYMTDPRTSPSAPQQLMRIPVNGGISEFVLETRNWIDHSCGRAPASCVLTERSADGKWHNVTAFDPLTGRGKLLRTIPATADCNCRPEQALSADGLTYAVARNEREDTRIQLLSLSNGPDREIVVKGWMNMTGMNWASGGKGFYCGFISSQRRSLLYVDLNGTAQILRQYNGVGNDVQVWGVPSPNGRYIAILADTLSSNVWMLGGF